MRVAIVTEEAMNRMHGTGVQLLRLFEGQSEVEFVNIHFGNIYGRSECTEICFYGDEYAHWHAAQSLLGRSRATALRTWYKTAVHPRRFTNALKEHSPFDVAYVFVAQEVAVHTILPLVKKLACPYIIHVMDLYHEDGLDPLTMPHFRDLLQNAYRTFAITEALGDELAKFHTGPAVEIVRVGQQLRDRVAAAPVPGGPLRFLMIGGLYPQGTQVLADSWTAIKAAVPQVELVYAGSKYEDLPEPLKSAARNLGQIRDPELLHETIAQAHIAYLSGPSEMDWAGKFSYPSRTSDYFMAGLPTIACIAAGSATERILAPLVPEGVRIARTANEIIAGLRSFSTEAAWRPASKRVRRFAADNFDIAKIRKFILDALRQAAEGKSATQSHSSNIEPLQDTAR